MGFNLRIFTRIFQPEIGRKIRFLSLGRKINILLLKRKCILMTGFMNENGAVDVKVLLLYQVNYRT